MRKHRNHPLLPVHFAAFLLEPKYQLKHYMYIQVYSGPQQRLAELVRRTGYGGYFRLLGELRQVRVH